MNEQEEKSQPEENPQAEENQTIHLNEEQTAVLLDRLRVEQNFPIAMAAGLVTGLAGAALWGIITVATGYQIGYMALAIGAGVGFAMRYTGKGIDQIFGIAGGLIAVVSCLLGNFFSIIGFYANDEGLSFFETLGYFDYNYLIPVMVETFSPIDLLFYGLAAYEGYKFSFRVITEEDLQ